MGLSALWRRTSVRPTSIDDTMASPSPRRPYIGKSPSWRSTAWRGAGQRVIQAIRDEKRSGTSVLDVARRAKAESSAMAARRLLESARAKTKSAVAAKGSRAIASFNSGYVYFLVLETSWWFTVAISLAAYCLAILLCFIISLPLDLYNTQEDTDADAAERASLALRFATAHVITGGPGSIVAVEDVGYVVGYFSMLVGVVVNVFVFAAVVAKFQSPQKDLVWSTRAVLTRRDGVPTLMVRVGNLRCHTLYNPTIRTTLLSRHVTEEGEGFMKKEYVEVSQPATISGVHTIACSLKPDSPLFPILRTEKFAKCAAEMGVPPAAVKKTDKDDADSDSDSDGDEPFQWLFHVTFTALDPVYGAELCSHTTYTEDSLQGPARFKDVISVDEKGRPAIDWHAFDESVAGFDQNEYSDSEEEEEEGGSKHREEVIRTSGSGDGDGGGAVSDGTAAIAAVPVEAKISVEPVAALGGVPTSAATVGAAAVGTAVASAAAASANTAPMKQAVDPSRPVERKPADDSPSRASTSSSGGSPGRAPSPTHSQVSDDSAKDRPGGRAGGEGGVSGTVGEATGGSSAMPAVSAANQAATPPPQPPAPPPPPEPPAPIPPLPAFEWTCPEASLPFPGSDPGVDRPYLAVLGSRGSRGDPKLDGDASVGHLAPHASALVLCLAEAGTACETRILDDDGSMPAWFVDTVGSTAATCAMRWGGADASGWVTGTDDDMFSAASSRNSAFARVSDVGHTSDTLLRARALAQRCRAAHVAALAAPSTLPSGVAFVNDTMLAGGLEARREAESSEALRERLVGVANESLLALESELVSAGLAREGWFGGSRPNRADAEMAVIAHWLHNALESGLSLLPVAPCSLADAGAPAMDAYLLRWSSRPSWREATKSKSRFSAGTVRAVVASVASAAPDACDSGTRLYPVLQRARFADPEYRAFAKMLEPTFWSTTCGETERALPGPSGPPAPECPRVAVLAARGSRGVGDDIDGRAIQGPIVPYCTYCVRLCLILAEARVPFQLVMIDRNCKQSWFRDAFPDFTTPAIQGTPGGVDGGAWVGDSKDLLRNAVAQNPRVAAVVSASAPSILERAEFLGERLKAALIGGRLVGSAHEDGDAFAMDCLRRCGKPEEEARRESRDDLRRFMVGVGHECVSEIEHMITSTPGDFIAGEAPSAADAYLAANLWVAHNLIEAGIAGCFNKMHGSVSCSLAKLGGPSIPKYLDAWSKRRSWLATCLTSHIRSAAAIRHTVDSLVAAAPDVAEAEDMYECMTRARAADAYYNESVAAAADRLPAVPPPEMRPKRVPGKVTTFKPADSGEVVFGNEAKPDGQGETTEASEAETVKETNTETASEKAPEASAQPDPPANPPAASASQKSGMAAGESQKNATKKKKPKRSRTNATICI